MKEKLTLEQCLEEYSEWEYLSDGRFQAEVMDEDVNPYYTAQFSREELTALDARLPALLEYLVKQVDGADDDFTADDVYFMLQSTRAHWLQPGFYHAPTDQYIRAILRVEPQVVTDTMTVLLQQYQVRDMDGMPVCSHYMNVNVELSTEHLEQMHPGFVARAKAGMMADLTSTEIAGFACSEEAPVNAFKAPQDIFF